MNSIWILAQADPAPEAAEENVITMESAEETAEIATLEEGANGTEPPPPPRQQQNSGFLVLMLGVMAIFLFMTIRGPRKKQQQHQKMVSSLKKNDRVRTIGGIFGTVVDVRQDDIVLKIDESNNTKIHIVPSAIGTVLSEEKN